MTQLADPLLAVAVRAARRAGAVIGDASRDLKRLPTFSREHGEIVTNASAEAMQAVVATIHAAFPDDAVVGDASDANPKADAARRWIVDSLDGTMNFVHGYPHYAISIALSRDNMLSHAVILDSVHDELFTAVKGHGAQLNTAPIRTSACTRMQDALIGTVVPTRKSPKLPRFLPMFNTLAARSTLRRSGSAALDLAYVAAGRLDGFFAMSAGMFDIAAGALLVAEAGGRVGDFAGSPDFIRGNDLIAAAPGIFNPLREALASVPPF
ncbi:MAG TPA: inositol monophosphatase family protein [Casimicrobiaceae bacterium]|nr:inositol monophosphatase family protein [Casimicrobiaceae bacterium]